MKKVILFFFSIVSLGAFAQNPASTRSLVNRTCISIQKAQKEMISLSNTEDLGGLEKAINYQKLAVDAYQAKNYAKAVCLSTRARELSNAIIGKLRPNALSYMLLNEEENSLYMNNQCNSAAEETYTSVVQKNDLLNPEKITTLNLQIVE